MHSVNQLLVTILRGPYKAALPLIIAGRQSLFRQEFESNMNKATVSEVKNRHVMSKLPVSVFIPVAAKDLNCVSITVDSLRKYLQHPIHEIVICGAYEEFLVKECRRLKVNFIDEKIVQPLEKSKIRYLCNGVDRSGWLYQQFLKLNSPKHCKSDHVLVWDSDTELLKPVNFEHDGKHIIEYSEERHDPYDECTAKLLGINSEFKAGFTCHKILFNRTNLLEMLEEIESRFQLDWYQAIITCLDPNEASSFSEYNLYSNYVLKNHDMTTQIRHWRNFADSKSANHFRRKLIMKLFVSVSYHSWAQ
jgi:hypothetical protein